MDYMLSSVYILFCLRFILCPFYFVHVLYLMKSLFLLYLAIFCVCFMDYMLLSVYILFFLLFILFIYNIYNSISCYILCMFYGLHVVVYVYLILLMVHSVYI